MPYEKSRPAAREARRGLATVAFLKARFDAGVSHLEMFQPFVDDAVRRTPGTEVEIAVIKRNIQESTGLSIPLDMLKTLLRRAAKTGLMKRHGGRYFRNTNKGPDEKLGSRLSELENAHLGLASRLRAFAEARGQTLSSDDEALAALMRFLDANHIGLVLGQAIPTRAANRGHRMDQTVAAFVALIDRERGAEYTVLEGAVQGLIVQNALLLRDIPFKRHFDELTVFLDTGVLLRALGYAGHTERQAAVESLEIIRKNGARLRVFERTLDEVESILRVYETKLRTREGVKSLRPTMLTKNWLKTGATPADLRQEIALIKSKLSSLGAKVREFPEHVAEFTEEEQALENLLRDPEKQGADDARVWHDVQAVAAILTLRAGVQTRKFRNAKYVFVSDSPQTVSNAQAWYREFDSINLEPIVHFHLISNAAWILQPSIAPNVPMHQLVAVCAAVLRPREAVWSSFVAELGQLVSSGEVGDDESIAVLASEFTSERLAEVELSDDLESDTVLEIVEKVREQLGTELRAELAGMRRQRDESDLAAAEARRDADQITEKMQERMECIATWLIWGVYGLVAGAAVVGSLLTLPSEWSQILRADQTLKVAWWACVLVFLGWTLVGMLTRKFHVMDVFDRIKQRLTAKLMGLVVPSRSGKHKN